MSGSVIPCVGAVVFECTNMAPYALAVQEVTGLPVFDIQTLLEKAGLAKRRGQDDDDDD